MIVHRRRTHFWQWWQILEALKGRDVPRQSVEQKIAGEPFLWKAVCPFMRFFLQWEQDMCTDEGLTTGVSVAGVTEKTDPILRSSCRRAERRGRQETKMLNFHSINTKGMTDIQKTFGEEAPPSSCWAHPSRWLWTQRILGLDHTHRLQARLLS